MPIYYIIYNKFINIEQVKFSRVNILRFLSSVTENVIRVCPLTDGFRIGVANSNAHRVQKYVGTRI